MGRPRNPALEVTDKFYVHIYAESVSSKGKGFLLGVDNTIVNEHSNITQKDASGGMYVIRSDWPYQGGWGEDKSKVNWMIRVVGTIQLPALTASNLAINPAVAEVCQTVKATVEVSNIGESKDSYSATLKIDGVQIEDKDIAILPGVTETLSFSFTRDSPGCYGIEIAGLTGFLVVVQSGGTIVGLLKTAWPELFQELHLLPELEETDMKDDEAIEDVAYLALNQQNRAAFKSMLMVGIKDQRKYCTPLPSLLWIAYDREFDNPSDNPLENYSLERLINEAWRNTTESNNFTSNRWKNFDEVVDRLNFPIGIAKYMKDNFSYFYRSILRPPSETFTEKGGACSNWGMFSSFCLLKNGFEYDNFEINMTNAACTLMAYEGSYSCAVREGQAIKGHVVTLYTQDNLFYIINMGNIQGPFKTLKAAVNATYRKWDAYEFRDIIAQMTKKETR